MKFSPKLLIALFFVNAFLSAGLLFLIEPIAGRFLLPKFGGSPAVWSTGMMFFQAALLLGYIYAHFSIQKLKFKLHLWSHLLFVLLPILLLPLHFPSLTANNEIPVLSVIFMLTIFIGLPFFVLATSGPLLQKWFSLSDHPRAKNPYFLYAASNLGSFVGLLGYPLFVEPMFSLQTQLNIWSVGYLIFATLTASCLFYFKLHKPKTLSVKKATINVEWRSRLKWVALAFIPSSLMLGVTAHITNDVAAVPLLWIIPLALYLLTFVVAFGVSKPNQLLEKILPAAGVVLFVVALIMSVKLGLPTLLTAILLICGFTIITLVAHTRLAISKPEPARLTEFYLWVSIGGALGGAFNSLIAPTVFNNTYEFVFVLLLSIPLIVKFSNPRKASISTILLMLVPLGIYNLIKYVPWQGFGKSMPLVLGLFFGVLLSFIFFLLKFKPTAYAFGMVPLMLLPIFFMASDQGLKTERTFFGVIRIGKVGDYNVMLHGTTKHGEQKIGNSKDPLSYYHKSGPVGDIFSACQKQSKCKNVASVGLGVGTVAAYGREGDNITFYEIDPAVIELANNPSYFTYLSDSKAKIKNILGDGRLSLQAEPDGKFDLLIIDAFSSDAIPIHLITREALQLYRQKLSPKGILALHISNRELHLEPILKAGAKDLNLASLARFDLAEKGDTRAASHWVVMGNSDSLKSLSNKGTWRATEGREVKTWTDDFSNILSAL